MIQIKYLHCGKSVLSAYEKQSRSQYPEMPE